MAGENRYQRDSLIEDLKKSVSGESFYQTVRKLECAFSEKPLVGKSHLPDEDIVRFCQNAFLAFSPSPMSKFETSKELSLFVDFLGLLGPNGPMPLFLTEYIRDRIRDFSDYTLLSFINIFNHRMISLFYRAWADCQKAVSFDRPKEDGFSSYILCMLGMGRKPFRNRDLVPDIAKLYYSGRFVFPTRNAEGLQAILRDYFQVDIQIQPFIGRWVRIAPIYLNQMGVLKANGILGKTLLLGRRYWDCQQTFRIRVGPLSWHDYQRMLPGEESQKCLNTWLKNYYGDEYAVEVQLILRANEVPNLELGRTGRLGYSAWIHSRRIQKDADQLILRRFFN